MTALLLLALAAAAADHSGRALFDAAGCRSCHRIDGKGGNTGPDLTHVGFRRDKDWLHTWLASPRAWKPSTLMPEPRLTPAARAAIVDWLSEPRTWTPAASVEKTFVKAGCAACHGVRGRGGDPVAPALAKSASTFSHEELVKVIRDGKKTGAMAMPAWGKLLSETEIEQLAAYVATLADGPKDW